jgi:hypothetical protein
LHSVNKNFRPDKPSFYWGMQGVAEWLQTSYARFGESHFSTVSSAIPLRAA